MLWMQSWHRGDGWRNHQLMLAAVPLPVVSLPPVPQVRHLSVFHETNLHSLKYAHSCRVLCIACHTHLSFCTRWFKYDRDWLCVNKSQFVLVIFEPPCTSPVKTITLHSMLGRTNALCLSSLVNYIYSEWWVTSRFSLCISKLETNSKL
jgi:hypothetical protein